MPASQLLRLELKEDTKQLREQLEAELAECSEVESTYRNKVEIFHHEYLHFIPIGRFYLSE